MMAILWSSDSALVSVRGRTGIGANRIKATAAHDPVPSVHDAAIIDCVDNAITKKAVVPPAPAVAPAVASAAAAPAVAPAVAVPMAAVAVPMAAPAVAPLAAVPVAVAVLAVAVPVAVAPVAVVLAVLAAQQALAVLRSKRWCGWSP